LGRGTRRCRAESRAAHMVHGSTRKHEGRMQRRGLGKDDGESTRRPVRQVRANDSKASRRGGRSDTCRHQRGRVAAKQRRTVSMVWASKPSAVAGFPVSAAKSGGGLGAVKVRTDAASSPSLLRGEGKSKMRHVRPMCLSKYGLYCPCVGGYFS